jgi:hypothetical protein
MRAYHKSWQSDRPLKPDSRRVKWYRPGDPDETIRLEFMDEFGKVNCYYATEAEATASYEAFIAGEVSVIVLLDEKERT